MLEEEKTRRRTGRKPRVSPVVQEAVNHLKQLEAVQLQAGLNTQDGHAAEIHRAMAVAFDHAAKVVLAAFDSVSRKPSL